MSKANKQYLIMAFMCVVIASLVVWSSNNVDAIENILD